MGTINGKTPVLMDPRTNQSYHTDEEKAEVIARTFEAVHNRAYESISPLEDQLTPPAKETTTAQRIDQQMPISPALVNNLIKKLPKRKAPGLDKITPEKLRNLPRKSIVQIYYILKACIHQAYFPEVWKIAKVHPVPKPGKPKNNINSYRPISLLSTLSKILEKIIHIQLIRYLKNNNIIIQQQFGFREGHSSVQQLLRVTEYATMEANKNRVTQLILLDIEKAFDSVWHKALIYKLQNIGTPSHIIKIIQSYLSNRKMMVTVNGTNSDIKAVKAGVPQGSILGPTLYNIYTNDIPTHSNTQLAVYADDTAIYASSWHPSQATKYIQRHIEQLTLYAKNWKLKINPSKTQAITFSRKHKEITDQVIIDGQKINWTPKVKYLGLTLDRRMSWAPAIIERARLGHPALRKLYPLISNKSSLNKELKLLLYKTCARPIILYGHQVWAAAAKTYIEVTQKTQNKFLRIILNKPRDTPIEELHKLANIQKIREYINESVNRTYNNAHDNPLISNTGNYEVRDIPLKIRIKLPKHATEKS